MKKILKIYHWLMDGNGGSGYSAAAEAVFTNIGGTLSDTVKGHIATFVDAEVTAGRWTNNLDVFQVWGTALGSEAQGLKNWISASYPATNPKPETATVNGYDMSGSGVGGVLTGYNPTTGALWTSTNAIHGVYVNRNDSSADQKHVMGYGGSTTAWWQRTGASRLDFLAPGMNSLTGVQVAGFASGYTQGLYTVKEEFSVTNYRQLVYRNDTLVGTGAVAAPVEINAEIRVGGRGDSSTPFDGVLSAYFAGAGTGFDVAAFYANFLTLITNLGVKI